MAFFVLKNRLSCNSDQMNRWKARENERQTEQEREEYRENRKGDSEK